MNWKAILTPLALARMLETLLSVVSFACTINFHGSANFKIQCPGKDLPLEGLSLPIQWKYPFWLTSITVSSAACNISQTVTEEQVFFVDFAAQAQFFVFVGVCSFVLSTAWIVVYVSFWHAYTLDTLLPTADLVTSIITALMWLCADCAWASGFQSMQMYLSQEQIVSSVMSLPFCRNEECSIHGPKEDFGNGGFGLTLGFINCIMWVLNAFLAYREQQRIKTERDRTQATPSETMDATSINSRAGFRAI